jgi:hypothetical protein
MKKSALLVVSLVVLFVMSCSVGAAATLTPTATPEPTATNTPEPTATEEKPTNTPKPTDFPMVTLREFERALRDWGYTAQDFSDGSGKYWVKDNVFEVTYTFDSGWVRMEVLNSLKARMDHMEKKFQVLDGLFPSDFMDDLRSANEDYADTVGAGVTGEAVNPYGPDPADFWKYMSGFYNVDDETIGGYDVEFALFFEQWTCPPEYICTFPNFGGQQFTGQASFVFYTIGFGLEA